VVVLAAAALGSLFSWIAAAALADILVAYAATVGVCAARVAVNEGLLCALNLCAVFPVVHFSYGFGYVRGILDFLILRRSARRPEKTRLSR
jgi:hypothetical protein